MSRQPLSWWSAADLLTHEDGDDEPIVFQPPTRRSSLKGRVIPDRTDRVTSRTAPTTEPKDER